MSPSNYCKIRARELVVQGFSLGEWVKFQRKQWADGSLKAERQQKLDRLDGWTWTTNVDTCEDDFAQLEKYVSRTGTARVPKKYEQDGFKLGAWVVQQRAARKRKQLDPERARRLSELSGWTWNPHEDRWEEKYQLLVAFAQHHGHARVPQSHVVGGTV